MPSSLTQRSPGLDRERLVRELVPPPRFGAERFSTYRPDPGQPSQAAAVERLQAYAAAVDERDTGGWLRLRRRPKGDAAGRGIYLDGGFGVGKTHLLASLWHEAAGPKSFGTFVEYTNLVGALGFAPTVEALKGHELVCIDEFELDDPGDTVLMASLLARLAEAGVAFAATSNTLPDALGEGRFAAEDFLREIQALSARFEVVTVDGPDYRHREHVESPVPLSEEEVREAVDGLDGALLDHFVDVTRHLSTVHPSRYRAMLEGVGAVGWTHVRPVTDQAVALRLVVLVDRLYDADIPVFASGLPLVRLFSEDMLKGGYRKKYFRALSRLTSLARVGTR
ncbi:cell division protein ZapE [Pedococcus sp. 5OH_020]|uniref:cell division protein ZapE n=1 Tax=Pedococcus sp. 5OH_020 TaxID=2989814 RepID=UPI0022E9C210|nr:cell division protein ZapE [Pedococcus sp. 5OH_020]